MTPGTKVRITSGPFWPACHDLLGVVRHHAPSLFVPVMVQVGGAMVTADVLPGEIEVAG